MTAAAAEAEVTQILTEVAHLASSFVRPFGSYTREDLEQEAIIFGLEALPRYDVERPLGGFLAVHMRNRLLNLKRDKVFRAERPCSCCNRDSPPLEPCERYAKWWQINAAKQSLAKASLASPEGGAAPTTRGMDRGEAALLKEVEDFVRTDFPSALRADYLRIKSGVKLPRDREAAVRAALLAKFGGLDA